MIATPGAVAFGAHGAEHLHTADPDTIPNTTADLNIRQHVIPIIHPRDRFIVARCSQDAPHVALKSFSFNKNCKVLAARIKLT